MQEIVHNRIPTIDGVTTELMTAGDGWAKLIGVWLAEVQQRTGSKRTPVEYGRYVAYSERAGDESISQTMLGKKLTERGCGDDKSGGVRFRTGIRFKGNNGPISGVAITNTSPNGHVREMPKNRKPYGMEEISDLQEAGTSRDAFSIESHVREVPDKRVQPVPKEDLRVCPNCRAEYAGDGAWCPSCLDEYYASRGKATA